jgi:hypothetical protein
MRAVTPARLPLTFILILTSMELSLRILRGRSHRPPRFNASRGQ